MSIERLTNAKSKIEAYEVILQEISKSIENPDPLAYLKRREKSYRQYLAVHKKKFREAYVSIQKDLDS